MNARPLPFSWLPGDPCIRAFVAACLLGGALSLIVVLDFSGYPNTADHFQVFAYQLRTQDVTGALLLMALAVAACFAPARAAALVDLLAAHPWRCAFAAFVALSLGALLVELRHPLAQDEYAALLQSRIFAAGELTGRFPPELMSRLIPPAYRNEFIYGSSQTGAIASAYWPGFALLLTPFTLLGMPWLCNPLLASLALVLIGRLAAQLSGEPRAGGWAMLLALASPGFTGMAITYFSMTAHLLLNLVFVWLLLERTPARLALAGLAGSLALVLHNPVPHALFAAPWIVWIARQPGALRNLGILAAGYAPLALGLGFGWAALLSRIQGDALLGVLPADGGAVHQALNFLWDWHVKMRSALLGPADDVAAARLAELARLWNWAVPGLALLAVAGWWSERRDARVFLLGLSLACTFAGFLLIRFNQGHGWGARYLHSAWGAFPILAALALVRLREGRPCARLAGYVATLAALSLVFATALRAEQIRGYVEGQLAKRPPALPEGRQIVFIAYDRVGYTADLVQNDPFLRGEVWYLLSRGPAADEDLMRTKFPRAVRMLVDRRGSVWRLPSTGGG